MKTLIKAIFIFLLIMVVWHASPMSDWHIHLDGNWHNYEWLIGNFLVVGIVFFALALALIVFVSLFAGVVFFVGLICATMVFVGLSFTWPVLLAALVLYWLFSDSKSSVYEN